MGLKRMVRLGMVRALGAVPFPVIQRAAKNPLVLPLYHTVSDSPPAHVRHLYECKTLREFEEDLEFFLAHYAPLSPDDLLDSLPEGIRKPSFLLSFDDGFREMHDVLAPLLLKKGVPAICFLNPPVLDNRSMVHPNKIRILIEKTESGLSPGAEKEIEGRLGEAGAGGRSLRRRLKSVGYDRRGVLDEITEILEVDFADYLKREKPYLSAGQVGALLSDGFSIGGHSLDHPHYGEIPLEDQLRQTRGSMRALGEMFPPGRPVFSFPFSDRGVSSEFFRQVLGGGELEATFGTDGFYDDPEPRHLQRIWMEGRRIEEARDKFVEAHAARALRRLTARNAVERN